MTDFVLRCRDVVAGYLPEVDILRGVHLAVRPGELVGIIGPNGAGKSTLIKAIFSLIPVRSGEIQLDGDDVSNQPAHQLVVRGVGYVPQVNNVFSSLTIAENLRIGAETAPGRFAEQFDFVTSLFPMLADRQEQRAGSLSGGERQMLAMARALMLRPRVLLLDEPSAGLSPAYQGQVFERIADINASGVSIVMVEQNARRCLQFCHRAYVLDGGRNAHEGPGGELLRDQRVVELYLGTLAAPD